eukprot:9482358-Pyramimonas_sp.AAC.1
MSSSCGTSTHASPTPMCSAAAAPLSPPSNAADCTRTAAPLLCAHAAIVAPVSASSVPVASTAGGMAEGGAAAANASQS